MMRATVLRRWRVLLALGALLARPLAHADPIQVAVAANFTAPMQKIAAAFEHDTGHAVRLSFGATGKFYAQIRHGAPFEILLAADQQTPARLEQDGDAVPGTRFTYATGRLALWSARPGVVDSEGAILASPTLAHLAYSNPALAPYGAAAVQTLRALGLYDRLQARLVQGESVAQAYQFVASGNAEAGFVALSQIWRDGHLDQGSMWLVPERLHEPLRQDAVLLSAGAADDGARALLDYLKGERARALIRSFGYDL